MPSFSRDGTLLFQQKGFSNPGFAPDQNGASDSEKEEADTPSFSDFSREEVEEEGEEVEDEEEQGEETEALDSVSRQWSQDEDDAKPLLREGPPPWDVFEQTNADTVPVSETEFWDKANVLLRLVLAVFIFLVVLATASLSKFLLLVALYNSRDPVSPLPLNCSAPGAARAPSRVHVAWVWSLAVSVGAPYLFTLLKCLYTRMFRRSTPLHWQPVLVVVVMELLHSLGLGLFLWVIAPGQDPLVVLALYQGVGVVPALLQVAPGNQTPAQKGATWAGSGLRVVFRVAVASLSLGYLAVLGFLQHLKHKSPVQVALVPVALLLVSCGWWENFVPQKPLDQVRGQKVSKRSWGDTSFSIRTIVHAIDKCRSRITLIASLVKVAFTFLFIVLVLGSRSTNCARALFFLETRAEECGWPALYSGDATLVAEVSSLPFAVAAVGVLASGVAFKLAKAACKIRAQRLCFALPLALTTPLTLILALVAYPQGAAGAALVHLGLRWPQTLEGCGWWKLVAAYSADYWIPGLFLGLALFLLTTGHVWWPEAERVAKTDKLFVKFLYCGAMTEQAMLLNRRTDDSVVLGKEDTRLDRILEQYDREGVDSHRQFQNFLKDAVLPSLYACATLWHETEHEMIQLLKSLFRMDLDNFIRRLSWENFNCRDRDYYEYEAHIMFDDAFEPHAPEAKCTKVNDFVKQFITAVAIAAKAVYPEGSEIARAAVRETPFGGQLLFTLPGKTRMTVHLKDKVKIRHKKRWSQVMYLYYLLSWRLMEGGRSQVSAKRLKQRADSTFLLTLDGDVDFRPSAVQLLVDRMRKNPRVGAVCGRIHPIGKGPMIWYQRFEYAVSHWLQKATEHVLGCVLCCPGCFSLFRASALMDDNVVRTYTRQATEAQHFVQYDQGEDRWLCTLLLQQGKRVDYCAAADALTFAPEGFGEFYNQRRRWTPSTMANVLDLLASAKAVRRKNDDISFPYIMYQVFLFVSSVLTPGTIFLLILGAINIAYPALPLYGALAINLVPVALFVLLCFTARDSVQVGVAGFLTVFYSLIMIIVLIGLLRQIVESGFCSVTAIFFLGVAGIFFVSALFHPQEFPNVFFGVIYYLAIPSVSMLLILYSLANLHVVSWGTRETAVASPVLTNQKQQHKSVLGKVRDTITQHLDPEMTPELRSDYSFSFGNLFRCLCCPSEKKDTTGMKLDAILDRLGHVEDHLAGDVESEKGDNSPRNREAESAPFSAHLNSFLGERANPLFLEGKEGEEGGGEHWLQDAALRPGPRQTLEPEEEQFWEELIDRYLKPLHPNEKDRKRVQRDLLALRNKACAFFFLTNMLFVTVIFVLESVSDYTPGLTLSLPCDKSAVGGRIEPISVAFTLVFGVLLVLQFLCMLAHRFSTMLQVAAITDVMQKKKEELLRVAGLRSLSRELLRGEEGGSQTSRRSSQGSLSSASSLGSSAGRRTGLRLFRQITKRRKKLEVKVTDLEDVVNRNVGRMVTQLDRLAEGEQGEESGEATLSEAGRYFPGYNRRSLFALVQLSRDQDMMERLRKRRENWQKAQRVMQQVKVAPSRPMAQWADTLDAVLLNARQARAAAPAPRPEVPAGNDVEPSDDHAALVHPVPPGEETATGKSRPEVLQMWRRPLQRQAADSRGARQNVTSQFQGAEAEGRGHETEGRGHETEGRGREVGGRIHETSGRGHDAEGRGHEVIDMLDTVLSHIDPVLEPIHSEDEDEDEDDDDEDDDDQEMTSF